MVNQKFLYLVTELFPELIFAQMIEFFLVEQVLKLVLDLELVLDLVLVLDPELALDLELDLDLVLELELELVLDPELALDLAPSHTHRQHELFLLLTDLFLVQKLKKYQLDCIFDHLQ